MDSCFGDITIEFLGVAFHNILYHTSVYPSNVFETRKKYNVVVYICVHPEVVEYINLSLKSVMECLKIGEVHSVVFSVTDTSYRPLMKFVFDINKFDEYNDTNDAYLIQVEQNLRAFILGLASNSDKFKCLPEDSSFSINIHTNESTAVSISTNPCFEEFPLVEVNDKSEEPDFSVIPLRSFPLRGFKLETYIELKES